MKAKKYYYLILLILFVSCKKESSDYDPSNIQSSVVIDSINNYPTGVDIYFRLDVKSEIPIHNVIWFTPSYLSGYEQQKVTTDKDLWLSAMIAFDVSHKITDTAKLFIEIYKYLNDPDKYNYDYRDVFVGKYNCVRETYKYGFTQQYESNYDTTELNVYKSFSHKQIGFKEFYSPLFIDYNNEACYNESEHFSHQTWYVKFFPDKDSIYAYYDIGALDSGTRDIFKGKKLK